MLKRDRFLKKEIEEKTSYLLYLGEKLEEETKKAKEQLEKSQRRRKTFLSFKGS